MVGILHQHALTFLLVEFDAAALTEAAFERQHGRSSPRRLEAASSIAQQVPEAFAALDPRDLLRARLPDPAWGKKRSRQACTALSFACFSCQVILPEL